MALDVEQVQQALNAAYRPLLDPEIIRDRLSHVVDPDWPDPDSVIRELNCPFLIAAHEQYATANLRAVIVGQENNYWADNIYPRLSDFLAPSPEKLPKLLDEYRKFIAKLGTKEGYNTTFFQYFEKLRVAIHADRPIGKGQSILWLNVFKLNYRGMCSWKSPLYKQMLAIQEGVLQAEIKALDPHVVIFLTGPYYDQVLEILFPKFDRLNVASFPPRQVMRIADKGKILPSLTFRSYHPRYVSCRGAAGWAWYQAIINEIIAKPSK